MVATVPPLADLDFTPYLNPEGYLPAEYEGKIGVYAIYSESHILHYVGYSRNVLQSLKQHLVRQPQNCYWVKITTIERPSRSLLDDIRTAWIQENGVCPSGNADQQAQWEQDIDVHATLTPEERSQTENPGLEERTKIKVLKQAARRREQEILEMLTARGLQEPLRFNPKLKAVGRLALK